MTRALKWIYLSLIAGFLVGYALLIGKAGALAWALVWTIWSGR